VELLDKEFKQVKEQYLLYLREFGEVTRAQKDACYAPRGRVWRLLLRQEQTLEREMERKLRLLWQMQRQDRERLQRIDAEQELEYRPEDAAEERVADELLERMKDLYVKTQAERKAAREGNRGQGTGNREVQRGQAQGAKVEEQEPTNPEPRIPDSGSSAKPQPATPDPGSSTVPSKPPASVKMTEQSEYVTENKGLAPENKAETNGEGQ